MDGAGKERLTQKERIELSVHTLYGYLLMVNRIHHARVKELNAEGFDKRDRGVVVIAVDKEILRAGDPFNPNVLIVEGYWSKWQALQAADELVKAAPSTYTEMRLSLESMIDRYDPDTTALLYVKGSEATFVHPFSIDKPPIQLEFDLMAQMERDLKEQVLLGIAESN